MACPDCANDSRHSCVVCRLPVFSGDYEDIFTEQPICQPCYSTLRPRPLRQPMMGRSVGYEFEFLFSSHHYQKYQLLFDELRRWGQIKHDGSLEGDSRFPCEAELATHWGEGEALWEMLGAIMGVFNSGPFGYNNTCGLHMHVGMLDSTEVQRRRIYSWWRLLEPAIQLFVPAHRLGNQYCHAARGYDYGTNRYMSLNVSAFRRGSSAPGTFEVRLHHMTFDHRIVKGWTQFVLGFFDTFQQVRLTRQMRNDVCYMDNRDKLIFMMQQIKAPLSLWKYAVLTMRNNYKSNLRSQLLMTDPWIVLNHYQDNITAEAA